MCRCVVADTLEVQRRTAATSAGLGLVCAGAVPPAPLRAKEFSGLGNASVSVDLPKGFTWSEKGIWLPTHAFEQRVTANKPYDKWTVGVTVDDVVAESLADVGDAEAIAERIANIERSKDGNKLTEVLAAARGEVDGILADTIEYRADTTRGFYHYLVRVALHKGKLYNVTAQVPEEQWPTLEDPSRSTIASFRLRL